MSSLDQLFAEYGYLSHDELTQSQIKILQTRLKETDESVVTSTTDAQHFLELLRKFREYIADAVARGIDVCGKSDIFAFKTFACLVAR